MKTPITCPKCHGPLLNTEIPLRGGANVWKKTCTTKLNHHFTCVTKQHDDDSIEILVLGINQRSVPIKISWYFTPRMLMVYKEVVGSVDAIKIPWVEPNLDMYDKLVEKIKTYITFS